MQNEKQEIFDVKEAAKFKGVHYHTINNMVERGELECFYVGTRKFFTIQNLLK